MIAATGFRPVTSTVISMGSVTGPFLPREQGYAGNTPFTLLGVITFDGLGNVTGSAKPQTLGTNCNVTINGAYSVNAA